MLQSYTVCGYCFKNLKRGSRCKCLTCQNKPEKICTRYTESLDMDLNESLPNIVGQDSWDVDSVNMVTPGEFVGAKVLLSPEVQLCDGCQADFQEACEWIAEIINKCMAAKLEESSDGSKSEKEK